MRVAGERRPSATARGYDATYRRARAQVLAEEPWCPGWPAGAHRCPRCGARHDVACPHRRPVRATTADHIEPIARGGTSARANLRGLCGACNSRRGQATARPRARRRPPRDAADASPRVWREV